MTSETHGYLYETENFAAFIGPLVTESMNGAVGYRILNKRTGVVEHETNVEAQAVRILHSSEAFLKEVEADPDGEKAAAKRRGELQASFLRDLDVPEGTIAD